MKSAGPITDTYTENCNVFPPVTITYVQLTLSSSVVEIPGKRFSVLSLSFVPVMYYPSSACNFFLSYTEFEENGMILDCYYSYGWKNYI